MLAACVGSTMLELLRLVYAKVLRLIRKGDSNGPIPAGFEFLVMIIRDLGK